MLSCAANRLAQDIQYGEYKDCVAIHKCHTEKPR